MLHSLVPQSPINSNPNQNPNQSSSGSAMRAKRTIDYDESSGDHDDNDSSRKRLNLSGEASISGEKLPVAVAKNEEEPLIEEGESSGLRLLGLLLQCAEWVAGDKLDDATDLLPEIAELSSPFGSSAERVAAYFAAALQARIVSSCLGTYSPLNLKTLTLTHTHNICNALQSYNSISPLIKFSHFTANQAIFQALDGEDCVHVIDLDIMQGLQWPGLFHILASRPRKIRSVRITGVRILVESIGIL